MMRDYGMFMFVYMTITFTFSLSHSYCCYRASLSAEREDLPNKSVKLMPDRRYAYFIAVKEESLPPPPPLSLSLSLSLSSVLVRLGGEGDRDYWSQKMAQFQGKHHRLVFTETMEKIYCRLYQQAINIK